MGVLDKFLNVMKMNDEDELEDEFLDQDEFEGDEENETLSFNRNKKLRQEKNDFEDMRTREETSSRISSMKRAKEFTSKSTPFKTSSRRNGEMEVRVFKPTSVDDSRIISENLISNVTILLNLEGMDIDIAQRIIDFVSGTCLAIDGNLQKVANYIFLVTPSSVDISGDLSGMIGAASFGETMNNY